MKLTPELIQDFVTISFCLEPLSEKEGCTTRFNDLPNKPLTDFIIAGINSGKYFRYLAEDLCVNKNTPTFKYYVSALQNSNTLKSKKIINFGLLELMFLAVKARILEDNKDLVSKKMLSILKEESPTDVENLTEARTEAWKTSRKERKKLSATENYTDHKSPYMLYENIMKKFSADDSSYQWAEQYINNLSLLDTMVKFFDNKNANYLENVEQIFKETKLKHPNLKVGIIADFCATALFLHFSYSKLLSA